MTQCKSSSSGNLRYCTVVGLNVRKHRRSKGNRDGMDFQTNANFMHGTEYLYVVNFNSGPVTALVLEREDAISEWRSAIGPTDPDAARNTHPERFRPSPVQERCDDHTCCPS